MKFIYWTVIVCVILWASAYAVYSHVQQNASHSQETLSDERFKELSKIGYKAPEFELIGLNGGKYSLAELKGKPVVLNFWASWCDPCKLEAPHLVELYEQHQEQLEIYAINLTENDRIEDIKQFVKTYHLNFPILLDSNGEAAKKYRVLAIPTSFFVNKEGIIVDQIIGIADEKTLGDKFERLATEGYKED